MSLVRGAVISDITAQYADYTAAKNQSDGVNSPLCIVNISIYICIVVIADFIQQGALFAFGLCTLLKLVINC